MSMVNASQLGFSIVAVDGRGQWKHYVAVHKEVGESEETESGKD
jgi:hypothetical protein